MTEVVRHRIPGAPVFAATLRVPFGWRHETDDLRGLAHFMEHAHLLGSSRFPDPDEAAAPFGTFIDGATHADHVEYSVAGLREDFGPLFEILADLVFSPALDADQVEAEREVVLPTVIEEGDLAPWERVYYALDDMVFETDGLPSMGTSESLPRISADDLRDHHGRTHRPYLARLLVAGDVDLEIAERILADHEDLPAESPPPFLRRPAGDTTTFFPRDTTRVELAVGYRLRPEEITPAVEVLRIVAGNYPRSRLWRALRGKEPLAYNVGSRILLQSDVARFSFDVGLADRTALPGAWAALTGLIEGLREVPVDEETLEWAKRVARLELLTESLSPKASVRMLSRLRIRSGGDPLAERDGALSEVTAGDVLQAARSLLAPDRAFISLDGPVSADDLPEFP